MSTILMKGDYYILPDTFPGL